MTNGLYRPPHPSVGPATDTALATAASFSDFLPFLLPPAKFIWPCCVSQSVSLESPGPCRRAAVECCRGWSGISRHHPLLLLAPILEHKRHEEQHQGGRKPALRWKKQEQTHRWLRVRLKVTRAGGKRAKLLPKTETSSSANQWQSTGRGSKVQIHVSHVFVKYISVTAVFSSVRVGRKDRG